MPNQRKEYFTKNAEIDNRQNKIKPEIPQLPIELILMIISHLISIEDLRNCFLISKDIRKSIYESQVIMRKIKLEFFTQTDFVEEIKYLKSFGKYILNLKLDFPYDSSNMMKYILNLLPNIENLVFRDHQTLVGLDEEVFYPLGLETCSPPELNKLKAIKLYVNDYEEFFEIFKNVKNVTKIIFNLYSDGIEADFLDFVAQQNNLKELYINKSFRKIQFSKDISQNIKFNLQSLRCSCKCDNFQKFLKSQAESLEIFDDMDPSDEVLKILFQNSKKLKKIYFEDSNDFKLNWEEYTSYKLDTVKDLDHYALTKISLSTIYQIFPNLENFSCYQVYEWPGNFDKLQSLNVESLYIYNLRNTKLYGLKSLSAKFFKDMYNNDPFHKDDFYWNHLIAFTMNVPNLETLDINLTEGEENTEVLLSSLRCFKNLKTFNINYSARGMHTIVIDLTRNVVRTSRIIANSSIRSAIILQKFEFEYTDEVHYEMEVPRNYDNVQTIESSSESDSDSNLS